MIAEEKIMEIKQRRKFLKNNGVKLPNDSTIVPMLYPLMVEQSYSKSLYKIMEPVLIDVQSTFIESLPQIYSQYNAEAGNRIFDSYSATIKEKFAGIRQRADIVIDEDDIVGTVKAYEYRINKFQKDQLDKLCIAILGIPILRSENWYEYKRGAFIDNNVSLIQTVINEYLSSIETLSRSNIDKGIKIDELSKYLLSTTTLGAESVKIPYSGTLTKKTNPIKRMNMIAIDQIGTYYGILNQSRQHEAGISEYYWITMRDNRVRPEHRAREMKVYSWAKPPPDGHPGMAFLCRCMAHPKLSRFF